jgi:arylsulfatase
MNYLKATIFGFSVVILATMALVLNAGVVQAKEGGDIIHDAEYYILKAQNGEEWDKEDQEIDEMLATIRAKHGGKRPNIFYILIDDIGFGQIGNRTLNSVIGVETPNINRLADEGLSFMRMYSEPSCTPTRTALMTGRLPIRSGADEVKGMIVGEGLPASEVTIAEVLSKAGYRTSHVGKWHMGDIDQSFPHNQGFDYAAFPVHQQVQLALMIDEAADAFNMLGFADKTQSNAFDMDKTFKPLGMVTGLEAKKGGKAREVDLKPGEKWTQKHYIKMNERYQRQTLEQLRELAKGDKPFFLQYWPLWPVNFVNDQEQNVSRNGGTWAEKLQRLDGMLGEVFAEINKLGIAENTLVVVMSDNGPMHAYSSSITGLTELVYRGGKTQHLEGGVRVDAFFRWPGVIKENAIARDIVHVSDLYTTFARLGQASKYIPRDRVIDGIDQTALLLKGENHGRRDYVYIYEGPVLRSIVKREFKMHLPAPGVPGVYAGVYNVLRDPREQDMSIGQSLWSGASFQNMVKRHQMTIARYPHAKLGKGRPYEGIENLRPETVKAVEDFMSWQPQK